MVPIDVARERRAGDPNGVSSLKMQMPLQQREDTVASSLISRFCNVVSVPGTVVGVKLCRVSVIQAESTSYYSVHTKAYAALRIVLA